MLLTFLMSQYVLIHRIDKAEGSDLVLPMFTINLVYYFWVEKMTVWTMTHIVKHSSKGHCENCFINCSFVAFLFWFMISLEYCSRDRWIFVLLDEHGNILLREMACSQAMLESSVDCSWEHPKQASKLFNIPESLEVWGIDELPDLPGELNEPIDRVEYFPVFHSHWRYSLGSNVRIIHNKPQHQT